MVGRLSPANNSDTDTADEVAEASCDAAAEERITCDHVCCWDVTRVLEGIGVADECLDVRW